MGAGQLYPLYHKRTVLQRISEVILSVLGSQDRRSPCFSRICRGAGGTSVSRFLSTQGTKGGQGWSEEEAAATVFMQKGEGNGQAELDCLIERHGPGFCQHLLLGGILAFGAQVRCSSSKDLF